MNSVSTVLRDSTPLNRTDTLVAGWLVVTPLTLIHVSTLADPLPATHLYNALLFLIGVAISYWEETVRHLVVLATVAGAVELLADQFLVTIGTLQYPFFLATLLSSPLYMPLSWAIALSQIGYLALRLDDRYGRTAARLVPAIGAMLILGFYESFAFEAGIWWYDFAPFGFIGHAPVFIIVAEGLMFAALITFVRLRNAVVAGVGFGLTIGVCYVLSFYFFSFI